MKPAEARFLLFLLVGLGTLLVALRAASGGLGSAVVALVIVVVLVNLHWFYFFRPAIRRNVEPPSERDHE